MARWKKIILGGPDSREKTRTRVHIIRKERIHMGERTVTDVSVAIKF